MNSYNMEQCPCVPNEPEVAVLVDSESESDDGVAWSSLDSSTFTGVRHHVSVDSVASTNSMVNLSEGHSHSHVGKPSLYPATDPIGLSLACACLSDDGLDSVQNPATAPPMNIEDADKDDFVRNEVLNTCTELLVKLETVRLSVLHLQYSLHAGALGAAQLETTDRSSRLWAWDKSSPLSDIFPVESSPGLNISEEAFTGIDVFGVTPLDKPLDADLDPHFDKHIDSHLDPDDHGAIGSELFDGAAATGCF